MNCTSGFHASGAARFNVKNAGEMQRSVTAVMTSAAEPNYVHSTSVATVVGSYVKGASTMSAVHGRSGSVMHVGSLRAIPAVFLYIVTAAGTCNAVVAQN